MMSDRDNEDRRLSGGYRSQVTRRADTVRRASGPWSPSVHRFLAHLRAQGCRLVPEPIAIENDREVLSYIPGTAGTYPLADAIRSEDALTSVASGIREIHELAASFAPGDADVWQQQELEPTRVDLVGHRDLGPYNMIFDGTQLVGIIDWDVCGPTTYEWDLALALYRLVPICDDRQAELFGWPQPPERGERFWHFCDTYGVSDPALVLDVLVGRIADEIVTIERRGKHGDPRYEQQVAEDHASAYRRDIGFLLAFRASLGL